MLESFAVGFAIAVLLISSDIKDLSTKFCIRYLAIIAILIGIAISFHNYKSNGSKIEPTTMPLTDCSISSSNNITTVTCAPQSIR